MDADAHGDAVAEFREPERVPIPARHAEYVSRRIRRRRAMRQQEQLRRRQAHHVAALITLATLLMLLVPTGLAAAATYTQYTELRGLATSGLHHLLAAKKDLLPSAGGTSSLSSCTTSGAGSSPASATAHAASSASSIAALQIPDAAAVSAAHAETQAAQRDFQTLRSRLADPGPIVNGATLAPSVSSLFGMVQALASAGYDVATIGTEWTAALAPVAGRLHGSSGLGGQALLTEPEFNALQRTADDTVRLLHDTQGLLGTVDVAALPLCASQQAELASLIGQLPRMQTLTQELDSLLPTAGWLLGVDGPRHFLVQTLDRTELRPTGGFAGEYGILTVENGAIGSLTLNNVDLLDYGHYSNGWAINNRPPDVYSWWPIANWGLRDSNLSPDFPTDARLVMQVYKNEGGGAVDGLINVTPIAIAHVLKVTGPIQVPMYNETVTADNLEQKIHYYQLDPAGEARNHQLFPNDTPAFARKRFAQLLAQQLEQTVKHLPTHEFEPLVKQLLADMQSRDIQVYLNNQTLEDQLLQRHAGGALVTSAGTDSFAVNHTNWSAAKSTPHIQVTQQDDVVLDDKGGATHNLVVTMRNVPDSTPYYGPTTYQDFIRVYAPSGARLLGADGFDTGVKLCAPSSTPGSAAGSTADTCPPDPYPGGELVCPAGGYVPGDRTYTVYGNDAKRPLDVLGGPTDTRSDVAGRAMWGGNVVIPINCTATLSLSWYVPGVAAPAPLPPNSAPYTLIVQRQAGTLYPVTVTIHPSAHVPAQGTKVVTYTKTLDADYIFALGQEPSTYPSALPSTLSLTAG